MNFATFSSKHNLQLAWRRISTTADARYKYYFRHLMEAYELSFKENIFDLYKRLRNNEYSPQTPVRIYYAKPSGLQRPITLLNLEDQIILQAIANIFAEQTRSRREPLVGKSIYSNWLSSKNDSDFFLQDWKYGYFGLRNALKSWYKRGYSWEASFDLSAFYETIPHQLLLKILAPHNGNMELTDFINNCLETWSADCPPVKHNNGIPQGPAASDFLAECIMLPIDEIMHNSYVYLRYVDDIKILGQSELEVRKALVNLDILCRERGLIPNSEKTTITYIDDEDRMVQNITPIILYQGISDQKQLPKDDAEKEISRAITRNEDGIEITDKSRLRYVLFRSEQSEKILKLVIDLWDHVPYQIDAFVSFLENYERVDKIIGLCIKDINSSPYDFVRGEAWKILARMCNINECKQLTSWAINEVRAKKSSAARIGAYIFLLRCEELGLGAFSKWMLYEDSALIQAISLQHLFIDDKKGIEITAKALQRRIPDPSLSLLTPIVKAQIDISRFGIRSEDLLQVTRNVYFKAGIIRDGRKIRIDVIGNRLSSRYKIQKWNKWRLLFGSEYEHIYSLLVFAESYYKGYRSAWLGQQDAFNDALFRAFQKFLISKSAPGAIPTTNKNGLIDYGQLINDITFTNAYPLLSFHLSAVHSRRSKLPSSHPYEKRTGKKAIPLKRNEQRIMVAHLSAAYTEITRIATSLGI